MAKRITLTQSEDTRKKIQTSQLINRLSKHAFGEVELLPTQIKAIEILLKKSLPDLSAIEITGDPNKPISLQRLYTPEHAALLKRYFADTAPDVPTQP